MSNPHELAVKSAIRMNDEIGALFGRVGTNEHPRGFVTTAYRNARRGLDVALKEMDRLAAVNEITASLRRDIQTQTLDMFSTALEMGAEESARQLRMYGIRSPDPSLAAVGLSDQSQSALDAILARVDAQTAAIRASILIGAEDEQIVGDENRAGILTPGGLTAAVGVWASALLWGSFDWWTGRNQGAIDFQKQAVAALDGRTTNCCLKVHGQIQPFDRPFHLTGTPRFADYMDWPAFHYWCRTSGVLYAPEFDMGLTDRMKKSARWFLEEREKGNSPDRDPADAF